MRLGGGGLARCEPDGGAALATEATGTPCAAEGAAAGAGALDAPVLAAMEGPGAPDVPAPELMVSVAVARGWGKAPAAMAHVRPQ